MNKLIKQLDQRAVDYAMSVCDANGVYKGKEYLTVVKEKFAELIVQECLEACSRANEIRHFIPPTQEQVVLSCMREIETHFGVEE